MLPRLQGHGFGRKLIETLVSALRGQSSPGLHLIVADSNQKAVGFYRHVGFCEIPAKYLLPATRYCLDQGYHAVVGGIPG